MLGPANLPRVGAPSEGVVRAIAALRARLLAGPTATAALEAWCAERALGAGRPILAHRRGAADLPPSPAQRERLSVAADEPVLYRRVALCCGALYLAEADNWYVPGRLTAEMNRALATTDVPFGRIVDSLPPTRHSLSAHVLWDRPAAPGPEAAILRVEALLTACDGTPFCEVSETYLGALVTGSPVAA